MARSRFPPWCCAYELDRLVEKAESKPRNSKFRAPLMAQAEAVRIELKDLDH